MIKVYHLSTCGTCKRIISECNFPESTVFQDVKTAPIDAQQLAQLHDFTQSYEALFNRRSRQYRALGLHEKALTESDYKKYLLQDYTFLKRPTAIVDDRIFIGNTKKTVADLQKALQEL